MLLEKDQDHFTDANERRKRGRTNRFVALEAGGDLKGTEDDGLMQIARLDAWETRRVEEGPCDFEHLQRAS